MAKVTRLSKIARELNVGMQTLTDFLKEKGNKEKLSPNSKLDGEWTELLEKQFNKDKEKKEEIKELKKDSVIKIKMKEEALAKKKEKEEIIRATTAAQIKIKPVGKIDISNKKPTESEPTAKKAENTKPETVEAKKPVAAKAETKKVTAKPEEIKVKVKKVEIKKVDVQKINIEEKKPKKSIAKAKTKPETKSVTAKETKPKSKPVIKENIIKKVEKATPVEPTKKPVEDNFIRTKVKTLTGPSIVGKIIILDEKKPSKDNKYKKKRKRTRVPAKPLKTDKTGNDTNNRPRSAPNNRNHTPGAARPPFKKKKFNKPFAKRPIEKKEIDPQDVNKQIKETLARLQNKKSKGVRYRREKRDEIYQEQEKQRKIQEDEKQVLKLTEFVSVNELSAMIDVSVNEIISVCMNLGLFVSINQRLDAETMSIIADEFGYKVEFVSVEVQESIDEDIDDEKDLIERPPIVTVMGHVDHGKTSLLDSIRKTDVIGGEAGGITQHIGAYNVTIESGRKITFLDTPGHEAFTAMRARGAKVTDIAVIIIAADDSIMPQTKEAINHASAANVPIVFAINKVDLPNANPDKVKSELAAMNYMVEEWGGKYQSHDISAKKGEGITELLEKILLEADMLELKANPNRKAAGTVIESSLDKGRGYVTTLIVDKGTLKVGDILLAGSNTGNIKAMFNDKNERIREAPPATPVTILGLNGATQAGDTFNVMSTDKEARSIANKRAQLQREQGLRAQKHITLDEIGRRIAIGNFQELNVIVKGDVDGSIEALSDSLIKQSTEEIQVNIIHKAIGAITESDIMLASASDAIIIGFQVRPTTVARILAEKEKVDIRLYSVIYDAINDVRDAMEGMLSPELREEIIGNVEIRETFKISKIGTIAGCYVRDGVIKSNSTIRIIRDSIVKYEGSLGSLKRFKDDVKEVRTNYECGLNIDKYNDIRVGDIIEVFEVKEYKKKLKKL